MGMSEDRLAYRDTLRVRDLFLDVFLTLARDLFECYERLVIEDGDVSEMYYE